MKRIILLIIFIFSVSFAKTLLVPEYYPTIQQAIISASDGDTVSILSDIYFQPDRLNINSKNIFIQNRNLSGKFRKSEIIPPTKIPSKQRTISRNWEGQRLVNRPDSLYDAGGNCIAVDHQGVPWVIWVGKPYEDWDPWLYYTRWQGHRWGEETIVDSSPQNVAHFRHSITIDCENIVRVAWCQRDSFNLDDIYYTQWTGTGWRPKGLVNLPDSTELDFAPVIASGGGQIWIAWYGGINDVSRYKIYISRWDNNHWEPEIQVSPNDNGHHWFVSLAVDTLGRPHLTWNDAIAGFIYYRTFDGNQWSEPETINNRAIVRAASNYGESQIFIDSQGRIHVVFAGIAEGETDNDVFYCTQDSINSWSAPARVNINDNLLERNPNIVAIDQNNLWIFWSKEFSFWDCHVYTRHLNGINSLIEEQLDCNDSSYCNLGSSPALDANMTPWAVFIGIPYSRNSFEVYSNRYFSSGIEEYVYMQSTKKPDLFILTPNPFTEQIEICYNLSTPNNVKVRVFNIFGRDIIVFLDKFQEPGEYTLCWKIKDNQNIKLSTGIYFCEIIAGKYKQVVKIVLSKK